MGDMGEFYRDLKEHKRSLKSPCPQCNIKEPKRIPTNLMPGQKCKVCGYRRPREE